MILAEIPMAAKIAVFAIGAIVALLLLFMFVYSTLIKKVRKGTAIVRTGAGGTKIAFNQILVFPALHRYETIDISLKSIEVTRSGTNGLICKDNMRANIKVTFFVRVNDVAEEVERVAQNIGCERASSEAEIRALFDAKFSEGLKTVGKRFDFTELYEERDTFRDEILKVIGTDLNGFVLDDCAIDDLEQTPIEDLDPDNILDAEGIRKITDRTSTQAALTNQFQRTREKVIKQQDVETREAVLELERQQAEAEAKQKREVANVEAREMAEAEKVSQEELLKSERARIATEEEVAIATENKDREVIVAQRNKERTDAVEQERVKRDQELESIDRDRVTTLKEIEKEKAVEVERKEIQDVIKDRVMVEKTVVEEQQKILDTEAFAGAEREKSVAVTLAEKDAEEAVIRKIKEAEAAKEAAALKADQDLYEVVKMAEGSKQAAELHAEEIVIAAEAEESAAEKQSAAKKTLAAGVRAETAAAGLGQAEVIEATSTAEAAGVRAKALAEAEGIDSKADAMKKFNDAGKEHEEFKLELEKEKAVELAEIDAQARIAAKHSEIVSKGLEHANIDIVGGESTFFEQITGAIAQGKKVERLMDNSETLSQIRDTFFNGDPEYFKAQFQGLVDQFGIGSEDLKNLTISGVLGKMMAEADNDTTLTKLAALMGVTQRYGVAEQNAAKVLKG